MQEAPATLGNFFPLFGQAKTIQTFTLCGLQKLTRTTPSFEVRSFSSLMETFLFLKCQAHCWLRRSQQLILFTPPTLNKMTATLSYAALTNLRSSENVVQKLNIVRKNNERKCIFFSEGSCSFTCTKARPCQFSLVNKDYTRTYPWRILNSARNSWLWPRLCLAKSITYS